MFAQDSPGYVDDVVLLDSTPVECGRSVEHRQAVALAPACAHHYSRSHRAGFGACACTCSPLRMARRARRSSPRRSAKSATSRSGCSRSGCTAASWWSATRATPAASFEAQAARALRRDDPAPGTQDEPGRGPVLSLRSGNGSSRSSAPSKTASAWNATAPAACTDCAPGSPPSSWHSAAGVWLNHYLGQPGQPRLTPPSPPTRRGIKRIEAGERRLRTRRPRAARGRARRASRRGRP